MQSGVGASVASHWEFATVQVFVGVMVVVAQTFSGLCQWLLETEVTFNLNCSVSK